MCDSEDDTPDPLELAWSRVTDTRLPAIERLTAARSLRRALRNLERSLAMTTRAEGTSWTDVARALEVSRQGAQQRLTSPLRPIVSVLTGADHLNHRVWYGLKDDAPGDRNYAYSRDECAAAYRLARARAEAKARSLGPDGIVDDGGIDRGSGTFWDLYIGE